MHEAIEKWERENKEKEEERRDYGIEKSNSGTTSVRRRRPVEGGGYGLSDIVDNRVVTSAILHFFLN